jgi:hypothetical protein
VCPRSRTANAKPKTSRDQTNRFHFLHQQQQPHSVASRPQRCKSTKKFMAKSSASNTADLEAHLRQIHAQSSGAQTVATIAVEHKRFTPDSWALLSRFSRLQSLTMIATGCTSLAHFPPLANLRHVSLYHCDVM